MENSMQLKIIPRVRVNPALKIIISNGIKKVKMKIYTFSYLVIADETAPIHSLGQPVVYPILHQYH